MLNRTEQPRDREAEKYEKIETFEGENLDEFPIDWDQVWQWYAEQIRKNAELEDIAEKDPATPQERFENHFRYGGNFQDSFVMGDENLGYVLGSVFRPQEDMDEWSSSLFDRALNSVTLKRNAPLYQVSHFAPKNGRTALELMKALGVSEKDILIVGTESIASFLDRLDWHKILPDYAASIAQEFQGQEIKKYPRVNSAGLAKAARSTAKKMLLTSRKKNEKEEY